MALPTPDEMIAFVFDLERRLLADVSKGREELRRFFRGGRIDLVPQAGGFHVARSEILPLVLLTQTPPGVAPEASRYTASSCAGSQLDFPAQQFQEVTQTWVPFEESIAVGWE